MSSEPKSMEEITFSVRLNTREGSTIELFGTLILKHYLEHWIATELLNNSALSLNFVMYLFW